METAFRIGETRNSIVGSPKATDFTISEVSISLRFLMGAQVVGKILGELQFAVDFEFIGNASEPPFN